jgi:hypothetical protein
MMKARKHENRSPDVTRVPRRANSLSAIRRRPKADSFGSTLNACAPRTRVPEKSGSQSEPARTKTEGQAFGFGPRLPRLVDSFTTLFLAASGSGHVEAAKYAFQFDKDVKAVDSLGFTAMHESVSGTGRLATQPELTELVQYLADIGVPLDEVDARGRTPIQVGDGAPLDQPIQRMADIIISRGGKPRYFPKEYVKPTVKPTSAAVAR